MVDKERRGFVSIGIEALTQINQSVQSTGRSDRGSVWASDLDRLSRVNDGSGDVSRASCGG